MDQILLFLISSLVLTLMPGPDILFVINQSLENKKKGFLISIGLCSGLIIHTSFIVLGLSAFIENNENLIIYLKYFGALYLFYLAFIELKSKEKSIEKNSRSYFLRGFYMNLMNPKVLLFFIAYFPNFLFSDKILISLQFLILGSIFIAQALIVFISVSFTSNKLVSILKINSQSTKMNYIKSLVLLLIGVLILI